MQRRWCITGRHRNATHCAARRLFTLHGCILLVARRALHRVHGTLHAACCHVVCPLLHAVGHSGLEHCECSASALLGGAADGRGTARPIAVVSPPNALSTPESYSLRFCSKDGSIGPSPQRCSGKTRRIIPTLPPPPPHAPERATPLPRRTHACVLLCQQRLHVGRPKSSRWRCKRTSARWRCQASRSERKLAAALLHCTALCRRLSPCHSCCNGR